MGAIFATLGGGVTSGIASTLSEVSLGLAPSDVEVIAPTVFAPVFEELFKGIGVALIALVSVLGLRELDGPLDGAIFGGVIGLGFTLTEDILYVANQFATHGMAGFVFLLLLRTVLLGLSHCTFTACTGLGFGIAIEARRSGVKLFAPLVGFAAAVLMHAMHNALPTFFGGGGLILMLVVSWAIDLLFFLLLAMLVVRARAIVVRELYGEVGVLLHPGELALVSSYFALSLRNWGALLSSGWQAFRRRRTKQLELVELAFIKSRRRRGEAGLDLDRRESALRRSIDAANRGGVWLGP